jgi:hypothetical protein
MAGTLTVLYYDDTDDTASNHKWVQLKNRIKDTTYDDTAVISASNLPFKYTGGSPVLSCQITDEIGLPMECDLVLNDSQAVRKPYETDTLHPASFGSNPLANGQINQLNDILPELTRIIIHDSENFMTLFVGRVYKSEEKFIANFGPSLQLHCRDSLQQLADADMTAVADNDRIIYMRGLGDNDARTGNSAIVNGRGDFPNSIARRLDMIKDVILKTTFGTSATQDITYVNHKIDKDRTYIQAFPKIAVHENGAEDSNGNLSANVGKFDYGSFGTTSALHLVQTLAQMEEWKIGSAALRTGFEYFLDATRTSPEHNVTAVPQQDFNYFRRGYYHTTSPSLTLTAKYASHVGITDDVASGNDIKRNMFNDFNFAGFENDTATHITFSHQGRREYENDGSSYERMDSSDWGYVSDDWPGVKGDKTLDARSLTFTLIYTKPLTSGGTIGPFRYSQLSQEQDAVANDPGSSASAAAAVGDRDVRTFRQVTSLHKATSTPLAPAEGRFTSTNASNTVYFTGSHQTWLGNIQYIGQDANDNHFMIISDPQEGLLAALEEDDVLYERGWSQGSYAATYNNCKFLSYPSGDRKFKKVVGATAEMTANPESSYAMARKEMARRLAGGNNDLTKRMRSGYFRIKDWPHVRWTGEAQSGTTSTHLKPVIAAVAFDILDHGIRRGCSATKFDTSGNKYAGYISAVDRSTNGVDIILKKASALGTTAEATPAGAGAWAVGNTYNIYCPLRTGMMIRVDNSSAVTVGDHVITSISYEWNNGHISSEITTVGINDKIMYKAASKLRTNPNEMIHEVQKKAVFDAFSLAANAYEARGILWWHDHAYLATPNLAAATLRDYNSFSWSGGIIKVHSLSSWPGTFQINPGNTDAALTYAAYTSPMQANKQYVLFLDRNDPNTDGTFDIRAAELTHDDDGYAKAPSFINMAYVTIGKNVSAGSKTLKGNFNSDGSFYSVTIPFDGSSGHGMGMVNIQFMNTFTNVDGVDGTLVEASRILQPNSMTSAMLSKGARPWSSNLAVAAHNNLYNTITWHNGTGGQAANLEFADGDVVTITAGTGSALANNSTNYMYLDGTVAGLTGSLTPQFTTTHGTATGDDKVLLALIVVGADSTQKSPLILPFNSKQPTINATAIAADAIVANHVQANTLGTSKLTVSAREEIAEKTITTVANSAPSNPRHNDMWFDLSATPVVIKVYDGNSSLWVIRNQNTVDTNTVGSKITRLSSAGATPSASTGSPQAEGDFVVNSVDMLRWVWDPSISGSNKWKGIIEADAINNAETTIEGGLINTQKIILNDGGSSNTIFATASIDTRAEPPVTGSRIELDYNGIYGYNSSGASGLQFYLKSTDGKAYFIGGAATVDSTGLTIYSAANQTTKVAKLSTTSGLKLANGLGAGIWWDNVGAGPTYSSINNSTAGSSTYGQGGTLHMYSVVNDILIQSTTQDIAFYPDPLSGKLSIGDRPLVWLESTSIANIHSTSTHYIGLWRRSGNISASHVYLLPNTGAADGKVLAIAGNASGSGTVASPYYWNLDWVTNSGSGGSSDGLVTSASWNTGTGVLTLGRSTPLTDLTVDLDGRYAASSHGSHSGVANQNAFSGVAVSSSGGSSSGSSIYADTTTDTFTLVAGSGITLTGGGVADTITIEASGGSGSGTVNTGGSTAEKWFAYYPSVGTTVDDAVNKLSVETSTGNVKFHAGTDYGNQRIVGVYRADQDSTSVQPWGDPNTGLAFSTISDTVYLYAGAKVGFVANEFGNAVRTGIGGSYESGYALKVHGSTKKTSSGSGWDSYSDDRIKTDVVSISTGLDTIQALNPVSYKLTNEWKEAVSSKEDHTLYGYLASEFRTVFPDYITDEEAGLVQVDGQWYYTDNSIVEHDIKNIVSVNDDAVVPHLVAAIKELRARIEALEGG